MDNRLRLLPEEIMEMVVEELEDSSDIVNLFKAYPRIGAIHQKKKGAWLFDQALPCLLPWMKHNEILACRQTCKRWFRAIEPSHPPPLPSDEVDEANKKKTEWFGMLEYEDNNTRRVVGRTLAKMSSPVVDDDDNMDLEAEQVAVNGNMWPKVLRLEFISKESPLWKSLEPSHLYGDRNTVVISFQDCTASESLACLLGSEEMGGIIRNVDPNMVWSCGQMKVEYNPQENTFNGFLPSKNDFARMMMRETMLAIMNYPIRVVRNLDEIPQDEEEEEDDDDDNDD